MNGISIFRPQFSVILIVCTGLHHWHVQGSDVQLKYFKDDVEIITGTEQQQGSYADLGVYPHWCLGDIGICNNGLSVYIKIKADILPETTPGVVLLTNGGHTANSDGVYLVQRYGDQYELGVSEGNDTWVVNFSFTSEKWIEIWATWSQTTGLAVYIEHNTFRTENPKWREYDGKDFATFPDVIVGLDEKGIPIKDRQLFQVNEVSFFNKVFSAEDIKIDNKLYYLGCAEPSTHEDVQDPTGIQDPISICRKFCSDASFPVSKIQNLASCDCLEYDDLPTDLSQECTSPAAWHYYAVSNLNNGHSYNINVSSESLQVRPYTKPYETVLIRAETNFLLNTTFLYDFGDGISVSTTAKEVSHYWTTEGTYTVSLETEVGQVKLRDETTIAIEDIDEGIPPEMIIFNGFYSQIQMHGDFELTMMDEAVTECSMNFGDGSEVITVTKHDDAYFAQKLQQHTFPTYGQYFINASCVNQYGTTDDGEDFLSKKADVPFVYHPLNESFFVPIAGDEFFMPAIDVTRNFDDELLSLDIERDGLDIDEDLLLPYGNLITFKSSGDVFLQRIFHVQTILENATILPYQSNSMWNLTTNISFLIPPGNNIFCKCSLGKGDEIELYVYDSNMTTELLTEAIYPELGYYTVAMTVSNDQGLTYTEEVISVEVPIETISLKTANITDKTQPVELIVDVNMEELGPDIVEIEINHDDGNIHKIGYRSRTKKFTPYTDRYVYKNWGIYTKCVTVRNTISHQSACTIVQVGQNITHVDLQTSTTARVTTGVAARINITSDTGTDKTYNVSFGDDTYFVFKDRKMKNNGDAFTSNVKVTENSTNQDENSTYQNMNTTNGMNFTTDSILSNGTSITMTTTTPSSGSNFAPTKRKKRSTSFQSRATRVSANTITVEHVYSIPGTYRITANVTNVFSWADTELCSSVIVDDTDISSCTLPDIGLIDIQSSHGNPMHRIRSEEFNLTTDVDSNCGDQGFYYSWKATKYHGNQEKPVSEICIPDEPESFLVIPALLLSYGLYRITVTVSPVGYSRLASTADIYVSIDPSNPYAEISGGDETSFLVYGNTIINARTSRDPDLATDNTDGLQFDLFFFPRSEFETFDAKNLQTVKTESSLVYQNHMYNRKTTSMLKLYQHGSIFTNTDNMTSDISIINGKVSFPTDYFTIDESEFTAKLFVSKDGRTNSTYQHILIKLTNSTSKQDQLNALNGIEDCGAFLRAVAVISGDVLSSEDNSTEADEEQTQVREYISEMANKVADNAESLDQVNGVSKLVVTLTDNPDQTSSKAREKCGSTLSKGLNNVKSKFNDSSFDSITGLSSNVLSGFDNVMTTNDEGEAARRRRRKRRDVSQDGDEDEPDDEDYLSLLKEEGEGATHSKYLLRIYEYIFYYEKAFRTAVRTYKDEMWITLNILKLDKKAIFKRFAVEWEPIDIERYINTYCEMTKQVLDAERNRADKAVAGSGGDTVDNMSGLLLGKMNSASTKRKLKGNTTQDMSDKDDNVPAQLALGTAKTDFMLDLSNDSDSDVPKMIMSPRGGVAIPLSAKGGAGTSVVGNDNNPFKYSENGGGIKSCMVSIKSLDVSDADAKPKEVKDLAEPMEITISSKDAAEQPAEVVLCKDKAASTQDMAYWKYAKVDLTENGTTLHVIIKPVQAFAGAQFAVYFKKGMFPNATHHDYMSYIPHKDSDFKPPKEPSILDDIKYTFFPPQNMTALNGSYYFGVALKQSVTDHLKVQTCVNYTQLIITRSCKFFNETTEKFETKGCTVGNHTTKWNTQCLCTHLTSFGGDVAVPPNTIDFSNVWAKFKNLSENAAVFSTVISLIGIYILLLIWARYMDKKDLIKWGATPLEDNLPSDNYHYQLTVQTGMRKKAGTKSKISFILSGENCDSGVRRLYDGHRALLSRGSIFNYICSVENPLGPLTFMRIWHDNSGKGKHKGWFLDQVQITDLQTGERYIFLCDQWLALEEDDGMVDRILPVAGLEDLAAFKQLFSSNVRKKLTNEHLWFSVFSRPTRSNFTRAQRISCCMSLLFMTMITNAMWFKSDERENQSQALKVGPVSFTMQQLFVSFASTMLVFPVNFVLMTFFRKCRPKKNAILQKNQQMPKRGKWKNVTNGSQIWGNATKRSKWKRFKDSVENILNFHQRSKYGTDEPPDEDDKPKTRIVGVPEDEKKKPKRKKKPGSLPHWCIYIAWGLCFLSILTSGFFTILYSMEWGKEKANEWLTTFLLSFFQSVIVVQPVKVMCLVAFIACILKKPTLDEEDVNEDLNNVIAAHDEEFLHKDNQTISDIAEKRKQANMEFQPPDPSTLEQARQQRLMELKMEEVLKEITIYLFFVLILFFLSYQNRDSDSFTYADNLKNIFFNGFDKISTADQYWHWMENKFVPALYATEYHNRTKILRWWDKRCIRDLESRRVGIPRLRQLRIKPDTCKVHPLLSTLIHHCRDEYGWSDDDTKPYHPGWIKPTPENASALKEEERPTPWVYQNSVKLRNAPYMATIATYKGGGYVAMFERNLTRTSALLTELKNEVWLDVKTRAVFMEFTVYNPNVNLFGSVIMVIEFMSSGGAVARKEVKVFRLLSYIGGLGILVLIFEAIYACFTLYFFIRCIRKVKKERLKYFKQFWNQLEFGLLCFCVTVIAMYAFKQILTSLALDSLKDAEKADYVNFQSLALYDELYGYMVGIVVYVATIQFLKLLQFNKKMNMLGDTIKLAAKDLKVFTIAFVLYFLAFTITGFLLFSPHMLSYSNFVGSAESMFAFTLGSFDFVAMTEAHAILGPAFFFLFIAVIYVGLMSIFLTIIADAFSEVKENCTDATNDYEIVEYMMKRVKGIMGIA